jgi:hypothetical protein
MKQTDIVTMLSQYGFTGLHLVSHEGKTTTYKFASYKKAVLDKELGSPSVAGGGKVAVYHVGKTAKFGVSPANSMVRVIVLVEDSKKADDRHLGNLTTTPELSRAFLQAQVKPSLRLAYCKHLWAYLNKEKFHVAALPMPKFAVGDSFPKMKNARGVYTGGNNFTAGTIWMANYMFNAREPFFLEVFLHEMCHQAAWCISKETDKSEQGHGDTWKKWMVKVGLDPRRYDPTDDVEYKSGSAAIREESKLDEAYGPRATPKELKALKPTTNLGKCCIVSQGRIFKGGVLANGKFQGIAPNGREFHFVSKKTTTYYEV